MAYTLSDTGISFENDTLEGFDSYKKQILFDYWMAVVSREASYLARKEVLTGKAKFGIVGDGKELPQIAMAKVMKPGDWRAGYYRDQTLMFALGISTVENFFAQLYADCENDPFSAGRQMNSHYATPTIDEDGNWLDLMANINSSSDISCTGGQMGRALGHALASKLFRKNVNIDQTKLSNQGKEITFCTIGDSSTSEGAFWEAVNAACVMKVPMIVVVWDDGYGISVPVELQTTKGSISKVLKGFEVDDEGNGMYIYTAKAWDYQELCTVFEKAEASVRKNSIPAIIHVSDVTQPQGHSTSGSHERYKTRARIDWERNHDCITKMAEWMTINGFVTDTKIEEINQRAKEFVKVGRNNAWNDYSTPIKKWSTSLQEIISESLSVPGTEHIVEDFKAMLNPNFSEIIQLARRLNHDLITAGTSNAKLDKMIDDGMALGDHNYESHLYASGNRSALNVPIIPPQIDDTCEVTNGYQVLNNYFDIILNKIPELVAFGEDVGKIGDVNQGFAGLQDKYGDHRVFDAGIREWTIVGQAIGMAMRGFRPIAEIQYLDYLAYAFSPLTDDLATLRYRSNGIQKAPVIIRSRGHRLEGIWHAGSPMGMLINSMKGIYLCVPRNMVQAAGMYNTLLRADDPGIVVECLNGYRLKESIPHNIGDYTVPLGVPDILVTGKDLTIVTYGSCVREAQKAVKVLEKMNVSIELIDVQTLMPFDLEGMILHSLKKTGRIIFLDEDVPGGATAFMMREILEVHGGYYHLDAKPVCITAKDHRTPFGSDGDYFTKPMSEDVVDAVLQMMAE